MVEENLAKYQQQQEEEEMRVKEKTELVQGEPLDLSLPSGPALSTRSNDYSVELQELIILTLSLLQFSSSSPRT